MMYKILHIPTAKYVYYHHVWFITENEANSWLRRHKWSHIIVSNPDCVRLVMEGEIHWRVYKYAEFVIDHFDVVEIPDEM